MPGWKPFGILASVCATTPDTIGSVQLQGSTDVIAVLFGFIPHKRTDVIHRIFVFRDLVFNNLRCLLTKMMLILSELRPTCRLVLLYC